MLIFMRSFNCVWILNLFSKLCVIFIVVQATSIYDGCSDEKQCFGYPEGCVNKSSCEMMASLKLSKENTDVEITKSSIEKSEYIAMAFSDDKMMGKDLVFACSPSWDQDDRCGVFWNKEGYKNEKLNDKKELIEKLSVSEKDSLYTIKFSLPNQLTINENKFDLEKGHYILLSTGPVSENNLTKHTKRIASTSMFGNKTNADGNW